MPADSPHPAKPRSGKAFSRRTMLRALLAASGGVVAHPLLISPPRQGNSADVLVIGAGMSGLAAARTLADEGYNVIMLEARNRIGGRVWTNRALGLPLDMGASWIEGTEGNPLTPIAEDNNIQTRPTDYDSLIIYDSEGEEIDDETYDYLEELDSLIEEAAEALGEELDDDVPLERAVAQVIEDEELSGEDLRLVDYVRTSTYALDYAADPADLSLFYYGEEEEFDGEDVLFPGGYEQIAAVLARGLDIRFEHIVERVEYGERVRVVTNQGAFEADYAIVTLPLGVLKRGVVAFDPPLPAAKQEAINRLGVGLLNKLYLRFSEVFWENDYETFDILTENGRWQSWYDFSNVTGEPIILGFNGGQRALEVEALSDAEMVADAMRALRLVFPDAPEPLDYAISRWAADPYAYGSYSYARVGSLPEDYDTLAESVGDVLFFAGEATHPDYSAGVDGAYLTGERAAEELMEMDE